jgi:haloalkane dehalogenase
LGLTLAARQPERIARLVVLNTFLPTGEEEPSPAFRRWRRFVEAAAPNLPIGRVVRRGFADPSRLSDAEAAAYEAPFPTPESKAGAVAWPLLVPAAPDDPATDAMRATRARLAEWSKPALVLFAPADPILGGARDFFLDLLPTARRQPDVVVDDAGHFLPDERGPTVARHVQAFVDRTG